MAIYMICLGILGFILIVYGIMHCDAGGAHRWEYTMMGDKRCKKCGLNR